MLKKILISSFAGFALLSSAVNAQVNLTAETASPGGATHLSPAHMTEIAGTKGIANIQLADGQTLTNSIQNVAEGKTDIAATPYILPYLFRYLPNLGCFFLIQILKLYIYVAIACRIL